RRRRRADARSGGQNDGGGSACSHLLLHERPAIEATRECQFGARLTIRLAARPCERHVVDMMNEDPVSNRCTSPSGVDRRGFLARLAGSAAVAAGATPSLDLLALFPIPAATPGSVFVPGPGDSDASVFAEARKHFLIPKGVTYCNTGTLGASPREVVDALVNGTRALETRLAAWAYDHPEGEPLTGYEPSVGIRTAVGAFINAKPDEVAITQNATMSMNFLANGLDLAPGDEVVTTDQEHGGCISPWRLKAKRFGIVVKEL